MSSVVLLLVMIFLAMIPISIGALECKCLPSDPCWPSADLWQQLNSSVNGGLLRPTPPASPCYQPSFHNESCSIARVRWADPQWRADQVGAMQWANWETSGNHGCPINATVAAAPGCKQGSISEYSVNATSASDIQQAVRFAAQHRLRLVVKNTGHDYNGKSTAPGSLSIWTHYMKNITFHDSFKPEGCATREINSSTAVTTGAGVQWKDAYEAADSRGLVVVGGMPDSVGATGGYTQGGGHGPLSHMFGLSADNMLQFEVVTAEGELVTANECQNEEIFWALRGGGGATFGVVVSATHTTFPAFDNMVGTFYNFNASDASSLVNLMKSFIDLQPRMSDEKWSGYFNLNLQGLFFGYLVPNGNASRVEEILSPLLQYALGQQEGLSVQGGIKSYPSFMAWRKSALCIYFPGCVETTGRQVALASRLIPREKMEDSPLQLAQGMIDVLNSGVKRIVGCFVAGGAVTIDRDNAVNPVWRNALWHLVLPTGWLEGAAVEEQSLRSHSITSANGILRGLTPGSGSYMNEADYFEPDWQESLFGVKYARLKAIKDKVDPNGLFLCHHCVGTEDWSDELTCPRGKL